MSGAEDFLRKLKSAGKVYIVTNGTYFVQKSRFDIAKLWDYICLLYTSPCPELVYSAAKILEEYLEAQKDIRPEK